MEKTKSRPRLLFELFISFFKIGAFTFGGGYAMIPLILREASEKKGWITKDDMTEIVAIAESTPGPLAINSATFVGYRTAGVWGSFFATFGVVLPSFLIISLIGTLLKEFQSYPAVAYAFRGIRAGVLALMFKALVTMFKNNPKNIFSYIVTALSFIVVAFLNVNALVVIVCSAVAGLLYSLISEKRIEKAAEDSKSEKKEDDK